MQQMVFSSSLIVVGSLDASTIAHFNMCMVIAMHVNILHYVEQARQCHSTHVMHVL